MKFIPRWRTDAFLACTSALNYANRGILPVVYPAMRADLHLSDVAFGLLASLFFWSYAPSAMFGGVLGDRFSRRFLVLASLVGWSASSLLCGAAQSLLMLGILRVAFGVSESCYLPSAAALQASHHGLDTRTFAMGLNSVAQSAGVVLGAGVVGLIAERWGWRWSFWALALAGFALALTAPRFLRESAATDAGSRRAGIRETAAYLARNGTFLMLVANEMLSGLAVWVLMYWLPLFLLETYHIKMAAAGLSGMAMLQLSGLAGTLAGSILARRFGHLDARQRPLVFAATTLIAAPCLLPFLFRPSYAAVAAALSVYSLLRGFGGVCELPLLCEVVPPLYQSTAVGLLVAGATSVGGVGVLLAAFLKKSLGLTGVFAGMSAVAALAGLGLLLGYGKFVRRDLATARSFAPAEPA